MTEQEIRQLAEQYGMEVLKRITTGSERWGHFATFELSGLCANEVWAEVADRPGLHKLAVVSNPDHPDRGKLYVEFESIWCEPEGGAA